MSLWSMPTELDCYYHNGDYARNLLTLWLRSFRGSMPTQLRGPLNLWAY
jgi:hypothetical protein